MKRHRQGRTTNEQKQKQAMSNNKNGKYVRYCFYILGNNGLIVPAYRGNLFESFAGKIFVISKHDERKFVEDYSLLFSQRYKKLFATI